MRQAAARLGFEPIEIGVSRIHGLAPVSEVSAHERPQAIIAGQLWAIYGMEWVADQIIRFAAERRIASLFWEASLAERGATFAYGVDVTKELGRAADQLARVLKGAKPAELSWTRRPPMSSSSTERRRKRSASRFHLRSSPALTA